MPSARPDIAPPAPQTSQQSVIGALPTAAAECSAGAMPLPPSLPCRPNTEPGSRPCPTTCRQAPLPKSCRPSTNSTSTNCRRSNPPGASVAINPTHRLAQVGKQAPPTRAAPSLVRGTSRRARVPPVRYLDNPTPRQPGSFLDADPGALLHAD